MYRKRDDLETLIKSLSNGEKRFLHNTFKGLSASENKPMYLELFEALKASKSDQPNDNHTFSGKVLTTKKRFLYKAIFKHLRQLHDELSVNTIIQNRLTDIEIMYNHSLPDQALILLSKTYNLAVDNEKFGLLLQILDWEKRLNIALEIPTRSVEEIQREEKAVMQRLTQVNNLVSQYSHVMQLKKQYGYVKGTAKGLLEKDILQSPNFVSQSDCLSQKARYYRNLILSVYYWMIYDHQSSFETSAELLTDPTSNILINDYVSGLLQHITSCVCLTRFDEALNGIMFSQMYIEMNYLNESNPFRHLYFAYSTSYRLIIYGYKGERSKTKTTLKYAELKLSENIPLPLETRHVLLGNMMNAYISIDDLAKAENIWKELFAIPATKIRKDIFADLFLVRIFFFMQTKEYDLIPPVADAALRYYRGAKDSRLQFDVEMPIALLFSKAHNFEDRRELQKVFTQCRKIISDFIEKLAMPVPFQEHYSRYLIWIDAIEKEMPFYEAAKEWYGVLHKE